MDGADTALGSHHDLLANNRLYADLVGYWDHTTAPSSVAARAPGPGEREPTTSA
jgi:hypothetical protein